MAQTFIPLHECFSPPTSIRVDPGCYVVTAITPNGESPFCEAVCFGNSAPVYPPILPTPTMPCVNYFLTDTTATHSNYTWAPYPDAIGYNVYSAPTSDPTNFSLLRENIPLSVLEIANQEIIVTAITPFGETPKCAPITFSSSCLEVDDYLARIAANGGITPSIDEQVAVCDFVSAMKDAGLWNRMTSIIYFSPNGRATALTWLKKGLMSDTWVWNNPSEEPNQQFTVNGILPVTYSDTTVPANVMFPNIDNAGFTGYASGVIPAFPNDVLGCFCGARQPSIADGAFSLHPWKRYTTDPLFGYTFGNMWSWNHGMFGTPAVNEVANKGLGYVSINRTSLTHAAIYYAASNSPHSQIAVDNVAVGTDVIPTGNLRMFESTNSNQYFGYCSFMAFHDGLSAADSAMFFTIVQNFRMALGGGYV